MVEFLPSKQGVASSNLVPRSTRTPNVLESLRNHGGFLRLTQSLNQTERHFVRISGCEGRWRAPYKDDVRYVSALIRSIWSGEDQILTGVPPSMLMIWLVMNRDSSVARNRTRLATSIGYPGPSIICIISNMPSNA